MMKQQLYDEATHNITAATTPHSYWFCRMNTNAGTQVMQCRYAMQVHQSSSETLTRNTTPKNVMGIIRKCIPQYAEYRH